MLLDMPGFAKGRDTGSGAHKQKWATAARKFVASHFPLEAPSP